MILKTDICIPASRRQWRNGGYRLL